MERHILIPACSYGINGEGKGENRDIIIQAGNHGPAVRGMEPLDGISDEAYGGNCQGHNG